MEFALTEDQRALARAVGEFLADRFGPQQVRAFIDEPSGDGDLPDLWRAISEQGWLSVLIPPRFDGLGLGLIEAQVVARAFGAGTVPGPWRCTVLAAEAVRLAGSEQQQCDWLPRVGAGQTKLTLAVHAEGAPFGPDGAPAARTGDRLTGTLTAVEYPGVVERIVTASTDGALWLVDPADAGVTVRPCQTLDRTVRLAEVTLTDAPAERLIGAASDTLLRVQERAAVLVAADLVGIARTALSRTIGYDRDRVQFGVPVGSFQAVKHALADLHVGVTMAEHAVLYAAHTLDHEPEPAMAVSVAKAKASDTARDATAAMIQYHGGIGYTWEHDAHVYFKRAKREEYLYGDGAFHRERLAELLVGALQ